MLNAKMTDALATSIHHIGPKVTCTGVGFNHELNWDAYQNIDYIFYDTNININRTWVITDRFFGRYPSDHFPICVDFELS